MAEGHAAGGAAAETLAPAELVALLDDAGRADADPATVARARHEVETLFAAHHDRIYWVCLRSLGNPERAAEVCQDTMLTAWRKLGEWRGEGSFYAWLYGIARYRCMNLRARKKDLLSEDGLFEPDDPARTVVAAMREGERNALLRQAARTCLDPVEQDALHMLYERDMGLKEITELLGIEDKSGARGVLQRAKRKLRRELLRRLEELGHGSSLMLGSIGG